MDHMLNDKPLRDCSTADLQFEFANEYRRRDAGALSAEETQRLWAIEAELKDRGAFDRH